MIAADWKPLDDFYLWHRARFVKELCQMGYVQQEVEWFLDNKGLCEIEIEEFEHFFSSTNYVNMLSFTKRTQKMPFNPRRLNEEERGYYY